MVDKVNQRLGTWKDRNLSMSGRITSAKSVIQAMPTYVMQASNIPNSICDEIDKRCRNFIWGDGTNARKVHLVNWETVCGSKKGGLGLRPTRLVNQTFMLKNGWHLCSNNNFLWVPLVRHKYICGIAGFPSVNTRKPGSNFWKRICSTWDLFRENIKWKVENGNSIRLSQDNWIPVKGPLISEVPQNIVSTITDNKLSSFVTGDGS